MTEPMHDPFDAPRPIDPLVAAKPSRRLHWWAALAIGLVGLGAYGVQTMLGGLRAQEPDRTAAAAEPPASLAEPGIERFRHELARQQETTPLPKGGPEPSESRRRGASVAAPPVPLPSGVASRRASIAQGPSPPTTGAPDSGSSDPIPDSRRYEADKRENAIASSKILAIQHQDATGDGGTKVPAIDRLPVAAPAQSGDARPPAPALELLRRIERVATETSADRSPAARDWLSARRTEAELPPLAGGVVGVHPPASKFLVVQGSVLPAVLLTEIRSDLPGVLSAQVTDDVYDSVGASILLVPRGTRLVGEYDSRILEGQSSVLAAFNRLIFPNGSSVQLGAMPAADSSGAAGLSGDVDLHFWARFGTQFLTAAIARVVQRRDGTYGLIGPGGAVLAPDAAGQILVESMRQSPRSVAALGPTITVRRGTRFDIVVNRDLSLDPAITGVR